MLRALFNKVTYRTANSTPDPTSGLHIVATRWGGRMVFDPRVPQYLDARRRRVIRDGLDPIDRALMDPDTALLLERTARWMAIEERAAREVRTPRPTRSDSPVRRAA